MPQNKVVLVHKDLPDEQITVSESAAKVHAKAGWKPAPKSQQPEPSKS